MYISIFSPEAKLKKEYAEALELYNKGLYNEALPCFENLGNYRNSSDVVVWCKYGIAQELITSCDWEAAVSYLTDLNYRDSAKLILQCRYNQGIEAMETFNWEIAASFFADLNFENSEKMQTDCSFMIALRDSVLRRMDAAEKDSLSSRSLVTTELAYLEDFRNADFFNPTIGYQAKKYIGGLDKQLSGLSYEFYYEYQRNWNTGLVERYEVLNKLYEDFEFMADNKDFIGEYINQLSYHEKWLNAFNEIEANGHIVIKDWKFTDNYVEIYFKNNTSYTSSQVFEFAFYGDENKTKYLGTTSVSVNDIGPYSEYTVRAYYTEDTRNAYYRSGIWVYWSNYYQEIKIN